MILFGASGHAKVIVDILLNQGVKLDFIIDDNPDINNVFTIPVKSRRYIDNSQEAIISIGNNVTRKKIAEEYIFHYRVAIHSSAVISSFSDVQKGTVIMANAIINPNAVIGKHCIINTGAIVEHDCNIGNFVHLSPNSSLAGNVSVGEGSHIGIGASVIQGVKIGKWVTVGAGAVVINDLPDFTTVVGNPAKIIKVNSRL